MTPEEPQQAITVLEIFSFGLLAAVGGFLATILHAVNNDEEPKWKHALVEGASSGFVGLLAMLMCKAIGLNWMWSGVIVGVSGWIGAEASISVLRRFVLSKFGIESGGKNGKGK